MVTDSSGSVCFDADYYPYGQENDYNTTCTPEYKFAGYEFDSETGNYYAYARYYNPRLGRFMSPDPLGGDILNPQSLNRYAYVTNNPTSWTDPLGLKALPGCTIYSGCAILVLSGPLPPLGIFDPFGNSDLTGLTGVGVGGPVVPGSIGTRGGGGGPHPPKPAPQTTASKILGILSCAQTTADKYSIAGLLGAKKGTFLGNVAYAFGGNSISQILDVANHLASGFQAASTGNSQGVAGATLQVQGDLMLGGTLQGVLTGGMDNPAAQGLVGAVTETVFGSLADTILSVKVAADGAVFAGAATYCAVHGGG